jgi:hypothetical protein
MITGAGRQLPSGPVPLHRAQTMITRHHHVKQGSAFAAIATAFGRSAAITRTRELHPARFLHRFVQARELLGYEIVELTL